MNYHGIVLPTAILGDSKNEPEEVTASDIKKMVDCGRLYLIKGWQDDPVSRMHKSLADLLKKPIVTDI